MKKTQHNSEVTQYDLSKELQGCLVIAAFVKTIASCEVA